MKLIYYLRTIALLLMLVYFSRCDNSGTSSNDHIKDTVVIKQEKSKDEALIDDGLEVAKGLTSLGKEALDNKKYKDSIHEFNKEKFWVYTIGVPYSDVDQLAEAFGKIKSIGGIAVYENGDEYTLIKTGTSQDGLEDSKGDFKTQLEKAGLTDQMVEIKNLAENCGRKNHIIRAESKKLKKKHEEIVCYKCD